MSDSTPVQVKLIDLEMTDMDTGKKETITSDIYDIVARDGNLLKIKNTETKEEIVVTSDMVEKYFYEKQN